MTGALDVIFRQKIRPIRDSQKVSSETGGVYETISATG
jgi:hypothetical protein